MANGEFNIFTPGVSLSHPVWKVEGLYQRLASKMEMTPAIMILTQNFWDATPGTAVIIPDDLQNWFGQEICSVVLQAKEEQARLGGNVPIKSIAEIRGSRFNTGKLRMDLIDQLAMQGLAAVLTKGAEKYTAHNWRDGLPYTETIASMLRHVASFMQGEDVDPETGLPHVDHIQCNAMFLSNMTKTRKDMDDRWQAKAPVVDKS